MEAVRLPQAVLGLMAVMELEMEMAATLAAILAILAILAVTLVTLAVMLAAVTVETALLLARETEAPPSTVALAMPEAEQAVTAPVLMALVATAAMDLAVLAR